jgi:hypothetical protein
LLDGYLQGDGTQSGIRGWRASTVSKKLAYGLAILFQKATNRVASIRLQQKDSTTIIEGRTVNQKDYYVVDMLDVNKVAWTENIKAWKQIKVNTLTNQTETVYNLAVKNVNSYCANNVVVHNCQPFSAAGKKGSEEDPRHLFPYIKEIINDYRPKTVFLENVEGIISAKLKSEGWNDPIGTPVLLHVLREMERIGYKCTWGIFSASEVGAPHQRKRVYIMGKQRAENLTEVEPQLPSGYFWSARPGQMQYEWEPPRTISNKK